LTARLEVRRVSGAVRAFVAALALALAACSSSITPVLGCAGADGIEPVCDFRNPEDMVAVPPGDWLLISQMADAGRLAGSIAAYQPGTGRIEVLFPVGEFEDVRDWGDMACAPPSIEQFAPHGIDIEERADGAEELLVVNHGGRESVEYLRVERSDEGLALRWRGCVAAPDHAFFNDVVARRDGGFWATDMMPKNHQLWATLTGALFGADTGEVYRFSPREGFSVEGGSTMPFPNGIEKGQDENSLYVASFFGNEVRRLDLAQHEVTGRTHVERPDNLTWSPDGKLLAAANTDSLEEMMQCREVPEGACGAAFEVVSIDPQSMQQFAILGHRGAPIGGVSVALRVGDVVYLGSSAGDRIARWQVVGETP
jgi:sugar lactone lactonase YvrE